jgi:cell division protein FtsB
MSVFIKIMKIIIIVFLLNTLFQMGNLYIKNNRRIKYLKIQIAQEENLKNSLKEKEEKLIDRYKNLDDSKEIEKIAREVLGLKKEEEKIYRLIN